MQNKKKLIVLCLFILGIGCKAQIIQNQSTIDENLIIGNWMPENSPSLKLEFNSNNLLYKKKNDIVYKTYTWSISSTSPFCNEQVPVGPNYSYLKLQNINDENDIYCYEIISLDDNLLQLRLLDRGGFLSYNKI